MEATTEQCNWCKTQLLVPLGVQTFRCSLCQGVTRIGPKDPLRQAQESVFLAATKFKGFLKTASSNINTMVASINDHVIKPPTSSYSYYPLPIQPRPVVVPQQLVLANGRKRAVLCGVSYHGSRYRLKGSVNDIRCMHYFLVEKLRFPSDSIYVLSEEQPDPSRIPTKRNIQKALQWLVHGCQAGDSLVFHYSGHGAQQRDLDRDEMDGYDETLLPVDHETAGAIVDDEINAAIVRPLPHGAKLHAIIDACHSGTVLDLPFVCRINREGYYTWEDHRGLSSTFKGTSGGLAISLSACDDHQISVDTTSLSGDTPTGAMTYSFIQAVQNEPGLTYGRLLNVIRYTVREAKTGLCVSGPISSLFRKVLCPILSQEPQLSSSDRFDLYSTPFCL